MNDQLSYMNIGGLKFEVESYSDHIRKLMTEYDLSDFYVVGNLLAIGKERLSDYQENRYSFQVVDKEKNIVLSFRFNVAEKIALLDITRVSDIYINNRLRFDILKDLIEK